MSFKPTTCDMVASTAMFHHWVVFLNSLTYGNVPSLGWETQSSPVLPMCLGHSKGEFTPLIYTQHQQSDTMQRCIRQRQNVVQHHRALKQSTTEYYHIYDKNRMTALDLSWQTCLPLVLQDLACVASARTCQPPSPALTPLLTPHWQSC